MIDRKLVDRRYREQALKERMLLDSYLIFETIDKLIDSIEEKLLEIDILDDDNKIERLRKQVLSSLDALDREQDRMDEYMVKYKRLVHEEEKLLSRPIEKREVYIRGIRPNTIREASGEKVAGQNEANTQDGLRSKVREYESTTRTT